jgi:hypothetical protein
MEVFLSDGQGRHRDSEGQSRFGDGGIRGCDKRHMMTTFEHSGRFGKDADFLPAPSSGCFGMHN